MKLYWTGTDSLMLVDYSMRKLRKRPYWFLFRILVRILEKFIQGHLCVSDQVADHVRKFGTKLPIQIMQSKVLYSIPVKKINHKDFNILYYHPKNRDQEFIRWLYGIDIIEQLEKVFPDAQFIKVDGSQNKNDIYQITDFLLRPNRHDGHSRMIMECEINKIPFYWTTQNPNIYEAEREIRKQIQSECIIC